MKIISRKDTNEFKNSETCIAHEYALNDKDINTAVIELTGRYPDKGRTVNEVCKEIAYVIKGQGKIIIENKEYFLSEGDVVLIEPGERYFWEGNLVVFVPCTPAWYPEQHKIVD